MTIDRIKYEETFPTAIQYKNIRLTAEATIDSGHEDVLECYNSLKQSVKGAFLLMTPSLPITSTDYHTGEEVVPKVINLEADRVAILIENATSTDELSGYWDKAVEHGLKFIYEKKLKELSCHE